ncbi:MAG: hypothetical protein RR066_07405 [Mucinivorans sp.]
MKKQLIVLLIMVCTFAACNHNDKDSFNRLDKLLLQKYPFATNIHWTNKGKYSVASFWVPRSRAESDSVAVWFGPDDQMDLIDEEIAFAELPIAVQEKFKKIKSKIDKQLYSNTSFWVIDDVCKLERDGLLSYKIEVEAVADDDIEVDIYFDAQGVMLKEVQDIDEDTEEPFEIPDNVAKWITKNFPKADVLYYEAEQEGGVNIHELDLSDGAVIIEVELVEQGTDFIADVQFNYPNVDALPADVALKFKEVTAGQTLFSLADIVQLVMNRGEQGEEFSCVFFNINGFGNLEIIKKSDGSFIVGEIEIESESETL